MEFLQSVGILDIIFIAILTISVLIGLIRGAIREILSLVGLAAAIYCAFRFSDMLSERYISQFFEQQPRISYMIAFVLIIVGVIFVIALVNLFISQLLKASGLSLLNRFFGLLFGVIRGVVICSVLVLVIGFIPGVTQEKWWQDSSLAPIFKKIAQRGFDYMPDKVAGYFESAAQTVGDVTGTKPNTQNNDTNTPGSDRPVKKETTKPATNPQQGVDVQKILQSIDNSHNDSQSGIQLESNPPQTAPNNNTQQKSELTLESYQ